PPPRVDSSAPTLQSSAAFFFRARFFGALAGSSFGSVFGCALGAVLRLTSAFAGAFALGFSAALARRPLFFVSPAGSSSAGGGVARELTAGKLVTHEMPSLECAAVR